MKRTVAAIFTALAIGCSGGPSEDMPMCTEDDTSEDCTQPEDAGAEVGTLEAPIVLYGEYGATSAYGPCTRPFPGGVCYGVNNRTFTVRFHAYSCLETVAPHNGAWWWNRVELGIKRGVDYLNARGWNVTYVKQTSPGEAFAHVDVFCYYGTAGTPMATTIINEGVDNVFDCHDTPHGDFCQYSIATIAIKPDHALPNPIWATTTSTNRANMIDNVGFHEMLHYAGLPHRPHSPSAMNVMMPAIQAWLSPQWTSKMVPDVNQSLAIYCYVPTSSTTPIVGCPSN